MTRKEAINAIKEHIDTYHIIVEIEALEMAIKALEQEECEDEEYEKNLNELKEQIFKEGNTLISKQDLLERFVEIDNEYKNSHWNLLQILANINILIGKEPCEDAVSRQAVIELCEGWWLGHTKEDDFSTEVRALPSVNPQKPKMGHWKERRNRATGHIETVCSECGAEEGYPYNDYCGNCGAQMFEPQESEEEE